MTKLKRIKENNISIYEELAPRHGELLYALVEDIPDIFEFNYKSNIKNILICDKEIYDLLIESNSFKCFLFFQHKEKKYFKEKNLISKKEILKRLFVSYKITEQEKEEFIYYFMKLRYSVEEKIGFYITALLYASENIFRKFFQKYYILVNNEHLGEFINKFGNNDIISTNAYKNNSQRVELIYEEILKIGRKRNIFLLHYVNSSYLGNEAEVFRYDFFKYVSKKEKLKWINYLFKNRNMIYHGIYLYEDIKDKYSRKNIIINKKEYALNLEFVDFIVTDIMSYIKENNIKLKPYQIKKLIGFKEVLEEIAKNIFLFKSVMNFAYLDEFIHEWELKGKLLKYDKMNILEKMDRKRKKI